MMTLAFNKVGAPRGTKHIGSTRGILGSGGARVGVLVASLVLAGCSLPSMGGLWGDDEEAVEDPTVARAESTAAADDVPGQDADYPNLASVPGRDAVRRTGRFDRTKIAEGLIADRRNAKYTEQIVRRDGVLARTPRATAKRTPSTQPRTTAVLGAASKPADAPPRLPPPPPSVTAADDRSGRAPAGKAPPVPAVPVQAVDIAPPPSPPSVTAAPPPPPSPPSVTAAAPSPPPPPSVMAADDRSGRTSAGKAPAVPAVPVQAVDIAPPSPPPPREAPVVGRPANLPPPPEATLVGRPAILPPPLPPALPQSSPPRLSPPEMPPPAATNGSRRPATAMQAPVGPLAGPPPPPPMLASLMPAVAAPVMAGTISPARIQLASASVAAAPAAPSDQVGSILFRHGSTRLTAQDKHLVRQIAGLYRGQGGTIRVVGHASGRTREADPVRHQMINFKISMQRANAVAAELRRNGVPTRSIVVEAKSNGEPKFQETMPSGEAGNRRADIFLDN